MRPERLDAAANERPRALTTPALTEPAKPSGLPMATTRWPTRTRAGAARAAAGGGAPAGGGGIAAGGGPDDGRVRQGAGAHHVELGLGPVGECRHAARRPLDDVGGGE